MLANKFLINAVLATIIGSVVLGAAWWLDQPTRRHQPAPHSAAADVTVAGRGAPFFTDGPLLEPEWETLDELRKRGAR